VDFKKAQCLGAWTTKILLLYVQLVDAFALSLSTLEQQMVQEKDRDPVRDPDTSMFIE